MMMCVVVGLCGGFMDVCWFFVGGLADESWMKGWWMKVFGDDEVEGC